MKTVMDELIEYHDKIQRAWFDLYAALEKSKKPMLCLPPKSDDKPKME